MTSEKQQDAPVFKVIVKLYREILPRVEKFHFPEHGKYLTLLEIVFYILFFTKSLTILLRYFNVWLEMAKYHSVDKAQANCSSYFVHLAFALDYLLFTSLFRNITIRRSFSVDMTHIVSKNLLVKASKQLGFCLVK